MPLSTLEQRVADEIASRSDDLLSDLKRHVAMPTGSGNLEALEESRATFSDRMKALGANVSHIAGDPRPEWLGPSMDPIPPTAACARLVPGVPRVLVAGHLDTVHDPAGSFRELSIRPDGKTATGPGCVDMKGGLVIAAAALEALEAVGAKASWTFSLNSDEETGTYHSDRALRDLASQHDVGLALEPALAGGELAVQRMGSGQFMLEVTGKSAHVGRAFADGVSAVTALGHRLVALGELAEQGHIVNVGPLAGGTVVNAVPDSAKAWGNARYPDAQAGDELGAMIDALATDGVGLPKVIVHRSFNRPAKPMTDGTERLALAARAVAEDLGQSLPFAKTGGVCDGNNLQAAGLPTIDTLGVRGGGLHTPDEWIELASLVERCQLLAILIARIADRGWPMAD